MKSFNLTFGRVQSLLFSSCSFYLSSAACHDGFSPLLGSCSLSLSSAAFMSLVSWLVHVHSVYLRLHVRVQSLVQFMFTVFVLCMSLVSCLVHAHCVYLRLHVRVQSLVQFMFTEFIFDCMYGLYLSLLFSSCSLNRGFIFGCIMGLVSCLVHLHCVHLRLHV